MNRKWIKMAGSAMFVIGLGLWVWAHLAQIDGIKSISILVTIMGIGMAAAIRN